MGLGAVGALGTAVQSGQISSLEQQVADKAAATDLALATTRIATLETDLAAAQATIATLGTSSSSATSSITSICTAVSRRKYISSFITSPSSKFRNEFVSNITCFCIIF